MGGRYYLTGVQMGLLMQTTSEKTKMEIMQEVMDNQFIGNFESKEWKELIENVSADQHAPGGKDGN